jgi:hypothetical protein
VEGITPEILLLAHRTAETAVLGHASVAEEMTDRVPVTVGKDFYRYFPFARKVIKLLPQIMIFDISDSY